MMQCDGLSSRKRITAGDVVCAGCRLRQRDETALGCNDLDSRNFLQLLEGCSPLLHPLSRLNPIRGSSSWTSALPNLHNFRRRQSWFVVSFLFFLCILAYDRRCSWIVNALRSTLGGWVHTKRSLLVHYKKEASQLDTQDKRGKAVLCILVLCSVFFYYWHALGV